MSYEVKVSSVDEMNEQYCAYSKLLTDAFEDVAQAVADFVNKLDSFQGSGANAIKSYFADVHGSLAPRLMLLINQLKTDYADNYLVHFGTHPIAESHSAVLPEEELEKKRGTLAWLKDEGIPEIGQEAKTAYNLIPSKLQWKFDTPNEKSAQNLAGSNHTEIELLKNAVYDVEAHATRVFKDEMHYFTDLFNAMESVIADCGSLSPTNYDPASLSFTDIAAKYDLDKVVLASAEDQLEKADVLFLASDSYIRRQNIFVEEEQADAQRTKEYLQNCGVALGVIALVAGVAGVGVAVATGAGIPAIIFALAETASAGVKTGQYAQRDNSGQKTEETMEYLTDLQKNAFEGKISGVFLTSVGAASSNAGLDNVSTDLDASAFCYSLIHNEYVGAVGTPGLMKDATGLAMSHVDSEIDKQDQRLKSCEEVKTHISNQKSNDQYQIDRARDLLVSNAA